MQVVVAEVEQMELEELEDLVAEELEILEDALVEQEQLNRS